MRILCQSGHPDVAAIHSGWGRVFAAAGHDFVLWDAATKPAFDAFDEHDPDLYLESSGRPRAVARCLVEHKRTAVLSIPSPQAAADTFLYDRGRELPGLACDFAFAGNYRNDKRGTLDAFVGQLSEHGRLKIVGDGPWPFHEYLGHAGDETLRDIYASARVSLNVSASGRTCRRVYNILLAGGVCLSNSLHDDVFGRGVVPQQNKAADFRGLAVELARDGRGAKTRRVSLKLAGRHAVLAGHTYWHRCRDILADANFPRDADRLMEVFHATVPV